MQFIALLRALGLAVASYGVSHAQIERRLCERITAGNRALAALRGNPTETDREALQRLVVRKRTAEESGLARTDGRRDRAGGQRIGELLAGKPRDTMPSRHRVEVCVDVFLEVLAEKDPAGYAEGRYGTRELWHELWLQADQRQLPKISETATTVLGYLDVALRQLTEAGQRSTPGGYSTRTTGAATQAEEHLRREFAEELTRVRNDAQRTADQQAAAAHAERDNALERAQAAEEKAESAQRDAEQEIALLRTELAGKKVTNARLYRISVALAALLITAVTGGIIMAATGSPWARPTHIVQLASPPQPVTSAKQAKFPFSPPLPTGRDWELKIQLRIVPTDLAAGCTYGAQVTAHVEADSQAFPSFTSEPGQTTMTEIVQLGHVGSRAIQLVVTRVATDPGCVLQLDPAGSVATATG